MLASTRHWRSLLRWPRHWLQNPDPLPLPAWSGAVITGSIAIAIELIRHNGILPPIPFLLLISGVCFSACIGGIRAGVSGAIVWAIYLVIAAAQGFGPPMLIGSPFNSILGVIVVAFTAVLTGHASSRNQILKRQLLHHSDGVESLLEARTRELEHTNEQLRLQLAQQKATETELQQSQLVLQLAFTACAAGLWAYDFVQDTVTLSPEWKKILGFEPSEPVISSIQDFFAQLHPEDRARVARVRNRHLTQRTPMRCLECRFQNKSGGYTWVSTSGQAVWDGAGQPIRIVGLIMDISDRKQAEIDLQKNNEALEKNIQARTLALEESNQALQRSNRDLYDFANLVAHDLQAPLRGIVSYAQFLQQDNHSLSEKSQQEIANILACGQRMRRLINDLLTYGSLDVKPMLEPLASDIPLKDAIANLQIEIDQHQAEINWVAPLPMVLGNSTQLMQLFQNLIENAIKFCEQKPQIDIMTWPSPHGQRFIVRDNGIGLNNNELERIFDAFVSLQPQTGRGGNGLGLALCRKIVEQHGGQLTVESKKGKGSCFSFTLLSAE